MLHRFMFDEFMNFYLNCMTGMAAQAPLGGLTTFSCGSFSGRRRRSWWAHTQHLSWQDGMAIQPVDGCEILHQLVDEQNPIIVPLCTMFHSHLRITNMQDFATIHSTSYFDVNKKVYQAFDQKPFSSMIDVEEHLHSHPNFLF